MSGNQKQREKHAPSSLGEANSPRSLTTALLTVGGSMAATLLVIVLLLTGTIDNLLKPVPTAPPATFTPIPGLTAPAVTPLASPPVEPAGDGTQAIIETDLGDIVINLYNLSAPVASQNFINLALAGYYDGVIFHRVIPDFVIQGGDPEGTGRGGPGFTIEDEPVVGAYVRGMVAMARVPGVPNSQGSQFFIILDNTVADRLPESDGYVIFGTVVEGMDVVDAIAALDTDPETDRPLDPPQMLSVTIQNAR